MAPEITGSRPEQNQATLPTCAVGNHRLPSQKASEVHHAVEIAANVRQAEEPRLRQRHTCDGRQRDDLGGIGEADQPLITGACEAETRRFVGDTAAGEPRLTAITLAAGTTSASALPRRSN